MTQDNEKLYLKARSLEETGAWYSAMEIYAKLGDHKDSADREKACREALEKIRAERQEKLRTDEQNSTRRLKKEKTRKLRNKALKKGLVCAAAAAVLVVITLFIVWLMQRANLKKQVNALIQTGNYEEALELTSQSTAQNAGEMTETVILAQGMALFEEERYDEAEAVFQQLSVNSTASQYILKCRYNSALILMNEGQYEQAIARFEALETYEDAQTQALECRYRQAQALLEAGRCIEAANAFEAIDEYRDAAVMETESLARQPRQSIELSDHQTDTEGVYTLPLGAYLIGGGFPAGEYVISGEGRAIYAPAPDEAYPFTVNRSGGIASTATCRVGLREGSVLILRNELTLHAVLKETVGEMTLADLAAALGRDTTGASHLESGLWQVGEDIPAGRYSVRSSSYSLKITHYMNGIGRTDTLTDVCRGKDKNGDYTHEAQLASLICEEGDMLFVLHSVDLTAIADGELAGNRVEAGEYRVGTQIRPGQYSFDARGSVCDLTLLSRDEAITYTCPRTGRIELKEGQFVCIDGLDSFSFYPYEPSPYYLYSDGGYSVPAGDSLPGVDFPAGEYYLRTEDSVRYCLPGTNGETPEVYELKSDERDCLTLSAGQVLRVLNGNYSLKLLPVKQ